MPYRAVSFFIVALTMLGCASAGRQAAWERPQLPPAASAPATGVDAHLARAREHFDKRDDARELLAAIDAYREVVERDPDHVEALVTLSRAYYFYVDGHLASDPSVDLTEAQLKYHGLGADYGERALIAADPKFEATMRGGGDFVEAIGKIERPAVPAAYWYCSNLGRFAVAKGLSAKLFYKDRVSAAMKRIGELDPGYFHAGADRYLGAFYAALPSIAGRDLEQSARHFDRALELSPEYLGNLVVKAEFLAVELDDLRLYESLLTQVHDGADGDDPDIAPENRAAKRAATRLLAATAIEERF